MASNHSYNENFVIADWQEELKRYWCLIENQTRSSLESMKEAWMQSDLLFDEKFKSHFLRTTYTKISSTLEQFLAEACGEYFKATFVINDTDQRRHDSGMGELICDQNQSSTTAVDHLPAANHDLGKIGSPNPNGSTGKPKLLSGTLREMNTSVIRNQSVNKHHKMKTNQKQTWRQLPRISEESIDFSQKSMTIKPDNSNGLYTTDVDLDLALTNDQRVNYAGQSQPQKRKIHDANVSGILEKKLKLADAMDTAKRFKCIFCTYSTNKNSHLINHMRTHTGERPYGCEVCGKRFSEKSSVARHMKTHRELIEFQCENCQQAFSNEELWESHKIQCQAKQN